MCSTTNRQRYLPEISPESQAVFILLSCSALIRYALRAEQLLLPTANMAPSAILVETSPERQTLNMPCKHSIPTKPVWPVQGSEASDAFAALDPFYTIKEEPIGARKPIRVVCMGAGYSGLMMAIMFSQKMQGKNAELVVYERNQDLGGTWLLNR